jgi:hypothetical protein
MCWACGEFNIVDDRTDEGMRRPTKKEQRSLDRDGRISDLRQAWRMVRQQ